MSVGASKDTVIARYNARTAEIQWRGIQRDAAVVFALVLAGTMAHSDVAILAPVPLLFIAVMWLRHDKRIGSGALYLRQVIEPAMNDKLEGYEDFVDRSEPRRPSVNRFSLSAVTNRVFFPLLQLSMVALGVYQYVSSNHHGGAATTGVVIAAITDLAIVAFTIYAVRHERTK